MPEKTVQRIAPLGIFFLASLGSYFCALSIEFFGDDLGHIVYNQNSLSQGFKALMAGPLADRPLLMLFVWLNYLLGGMDPFVYRLSSVILHSFVCWVGFELFMQMTPTLSSIKKGLVALVFVLFAVHPVNSQAVTTVIQSGVLISCLLMLCSFWYFLKYIQSRRLKNFCFVLLFFLLALLAKPNVIVFPLIVLLYLRWFTDRSWKSSLKPVLLLFLVACLPAAYYFIFKLNVQSDAHPWWLYFSVQGKAILSYMKILVWPFNLHFLYDLQPLGFNWINCLSLLLHIIFIGFLLGPGKKYNKVASFFILSMYILFIPESSFFSIRHMAFEHRSYVPFVFLFMGLASVVANIQFSNKIKAVVLSLFIPFLVAANVQRISEISTFEKWVLNTIEHDRTDRNFNIFQLDHFIQENPQFGLKVSSLLVTGDPDDEVYQIFNKIYAYLNNNLNELEVSESLFEVLTTADKPFHWLARYSFNRFYLTHLLKESSPLTEALKFDDLIFPQISELLRNFEKYQAFFKSYVRRLILLNEAKGSSQVGRYRHLRAKIVLYKLYKQGEITDIQTLRQSMENDLTMAQKEELSYIMNLKVELK